MSDHYDIKPTEADLNDENLTELELLSRGEKSDTYGPAAFSRHSGYRGCQKCETVGAHQYAMVCQCCGLQQSRFDAPEESDVAYD